MMKRILLITLTMVFFQSCIGTSGGGRKGLPKIKDFSKSGGTSTEFCNLFVTDLAVANGDTSVCLNECAEGSHIGDSADLASLQADIDKAETDGTIDADTKAFLGNMQSSAQGICFEDKIVRPTGEVFVNRDFCSCLQGKADIINNCESFCAGKPTVSTPTLFGSVKVGAPIELNGELGNLHGWCSNEITGSDQSAPNCVMEVFDGLSTTTVDFSTFSGSNSFQANLTALEKNKTYVATIVEKGSGAKSNEFQIRRVDPPDDGTGDTTTPLKIMPVSQYTCLNRTGTLPDTTQCGETANGDEIFNCGTREFYYFASNNSPPPMPPGSHFILCHDPQFGTDDSPLFPRLELIPQHIAMWDQADIRFADQNGDSRPDINQLIQDRLATEFNQTRTINIFGLFRWPNKPNTGSGSATTPNVGFYMQPWIDSITGRGFCPKQEQYNGTDPVFKIMKEVVGVDTEGIYIAVKQPEASDQQEGGNKLQLIREGLLNKIWFYFENGQHFVPDAITSSQKTIMYYWPPDVNDPYVQKSTQKIYTVRAPEDINSAGASSGLVTTVRPPDKRFGCVPAMD
ncbi:MAG: hypothetical protein KC478_10465 [Bacteriovoracaceae bacterium]|nr:hypothetical protein [Bacteriovoracaceae bacterium]